MDHDYVASVLNTFVKDLIGQGKLEEAERLLREDIANLRRKDPAALLALSLEHFSLVLWVQGNLGDAKSAHQEAIKACVDIHGVRSTPSMNEIAWCIATSELSTPAEAQWAVNLSEKAVATTSRQDPATLDTLAAAYARCGQFAKAVVVEQEALDRLTNSLWSTDFASRLKLYQAGQPDDLECAEVLTAYADRLLTEGKFVEAESPSRRSLAIRERQAPDDWSTFNSRSLLGVSLLGQKRYAEAQPLLLAGYEGLKQRETTIPKSEKPRLQEALQRVVQLYEATGHPDQAADWRKKLAPVQP